MGIWDFLSTQSGGVLIGGAVTIIASLGSLWMQGRKESQLLDKRQRQDSAKLEYDRSLFFYNEMSVAISQYLAAINLDTCASILDAGNNSKQWLRAITEAQQKAQAVTLHCGEALRLEIQQFQNDLLRLHSDKLEIKDRIEGFFEDHRNLERISREYLDSIRPTPPSF